MPQQSPASSAPTELWAMGDESSKALAGLATIGPLLAAARALSGLHVNEIAKLSMLGPATVRRAEASKTNLTPSNLDRLVRAYAGLNIFFFVDERDRRGVATNAAPWLRPSHSSPEDAAEAIPYDGPRRRAPRRRRPAD